MTNPAQCPGRGELGIRSEGLDPLEPTHHSGQGWHPSPAEQWTDFRKHPGARGQAHNKQREENFPWC